MKALHGLLLFACLVLSPLLHADDGYRLWLRYDKLGDESLRSRYDADLKALVLPDLNSPSLKAAADELQAGLGGLLGRELPRTKDSSAPGTLELIRFSELKQDGAVSLEDQAAAGEEGYVLRTVGSPGKRHLLIAAKTDLGLLYGSFAFLREVQQGRPLDTLREVSSPKIQRRILNHWDNLNRTIERGYAGQSIWEWFQLPDYVTPRYRDYARACASIGLNGTVLNNVNADATLLTAPWLEKVEAIAAALRPYGLRVYVSLRFSAPMNIGGLKSSDPLNPEVRKWWAAKADEIYKVIPDFGGFLVKANSEGEPGPQDYGRTHADGANMLAEALAPHQGIVMWRAFVYDGLHEADRTRRGYTEFKPLDGKFLPNVVVQIKNGPLDFMPREPFHPLFGAMPATALALEVQITQEYLGGSVHLAFLAPMWKECLEADTFSHGAGSTVAKVIDGSLDGHRLSVIAGVANIGTDRNWCGHPLASANWYAFGRLAWDHTLSSGHIAEEWTRLNFPGSEKALQTVPPMLLSSRETLVNYSMPLGLNHIMAYDHHYGPGPWVEKAARPDWASAYYHRADKQGLGFERGENGSRALAQYAPQAALVWSDPKTCPDTYLLWFHHLPWTFQMKSGRSLWEELCLHYQAGVASVRAWQRSWESLRGSIDEERFQHVRALLARQEREARQWRDSCTQYFQTYSGLPLPAGVEPPEHPLEYYKAIKLHQVPGLYPLK